MARRGGNPDRPTLGPGPGRPKGSPNRVTRDRVEHELRYIAFSDPLLLFDRGAKGRREFKLRDLHEMPEAMRRCIASVKVRTESLRAGDDQQDMTVEIRLWSKTQALELCALALGMLKDNVNITVDDEILSRLDAWKVKNRTTPREE